MFSRCLASSVRSVATSSTRPAISAGAAMSRYFSATANTKGTSIFVARLSLVTDRMALTEAFKPFGKISRVKVPMRNGRSAGYGFVDFDDDQPNGMTSKECAEKAIAEMNDTTLDGRVIGVEETKNKPNGEGQVDETTEKV